MAWKVFFNPFWLSKTEYKSKLREFYIMLFLFFVIINYLRQVTEKFREVGRANGSSLKLLLEWTGNVHFCKICDITLLVGGP